jgi:hypothetical protein
MDASTLKQICSQKLASAVSWDSDRLSKERQEAEKYYRGDPFGNEKEGRSQVVSRDVAEAIDGALPGVLKPFISSDTVVVCQPRRSQDEAAARQATDYLNWAFQNQPNAFSLIQSWVKAGLMFKLGVVKSWWEESVEVTTEKYEGLTAVQLLTLIDDDNTEVVEITGKGPDGAELDVDTMAAKLGQGPAPAQPALPAPNAGGQPGAPPPPAAPLQAPAPMLDDGSTYDVKIKKQEKTGRIAIASLPSEEFLTERWTVSLHTTSFCAHRARRTISDLIEMGYPKEKVWDLGSSDELDFNREAVTRFEDEGGTPGRLDDNEDPSMRQVWYAECYLKVDFDGDGIAEWRKVCMAGNDGYRILDNEETEGHPFSAWCPYPHPYKLHGESMTDKTMDVQLVKSTLNRQTLDGMYFNNTPQLVVLEGKVNAEDASTRVPGSAIRVKDMNAVKALETQDVSGSGFQMLDYWDRIREQRTGIRRFAGSGQADSLNPYNKTATGAAIVEDSSQDQQMLLSRNFAEQGLVQLFERMLGLMARHQDKETTVRLRGEWVNIDPKIWRTKMDMQVAVGLGTGNRTQQVNQLMAMLSQVDMPIVQQQGGLNGPLLTAPNVYKKLEKLCEAMGFKENDGFYTDPSTIPPQQPAPPPPDPAAELAKAQLAAIQEQAQAKLRIDRESAAQKSQLQREQAYLDAMLEMLKAEHNMALEEFKAAVKANDIMAANAAKARAAAISAQMKTLAANEPAVMQ